MEAVRKVLGDEYAQEEEVENSIKLRNDLPNFK